MATSSFLFPPGDGIHSEGHGKNLPHISPSNKSSPSSSKTTALSASNKDVKDPPSIHQIYEGQKFYWRLRLNVDLNFIFHRPEKLLEVISYDSDKSLELNRLYLHSDAVTEMISSDLNFKVQELKKELSRDRFKKVPPDSELIAKVGDNLMTQFILNRLIAVHENGVNVMKLSLLSADTFDMTKIVLDREEAIAAGLGEMGPEEGRAEGMELENTPPSLASSSSVLAPATSTGPQPSSSSPQIPPTIGADSSATAAKDSKVKINRRRKTTSGEFDKALTSLRQNSMELNQACDRAAKLTELSSRSVNSFKDALKIHTHQFDKTKPLDRFKWAVHRVILNNTVDRVRAQLSQREKSKTPLRINATFPLPDGSIINPANAAAQLQRIPLLTKIHETYSNGPSPFQSPIVTPRGKNPRRTPPASISKSSSMAVEPAPMPVLNQRKSSTGKTLMASHSMPLEAHSTQPSSPVHLPSLPTKDGKSPNGPAASATGGSSSGSGKEKKKTKK
jgi:hypothetical protein